MISLAQTSLKEKERLQTDTDTAAANKKNEMMTQCVIHMKLIMYKFIMKVGDNINAIRFLALVLVEY